MKIAIIGSGISGLSAAYYLHKKHDISVFEKAQDIGGHTATKKIEYLGDSQTVDTGFIVYNERTYPNFIKLLDELKVKTQVSSMGFSVACDTSGLEYAGNNLNSLFAQRRNILSPKFLTMLKDIVRFNKESACDLENNIVDNNITLGEYLAEQKYSQAFSNYYLMPMGAAIWSASPKTIYDFPLLFFVRFFKNHGLLDIFNRPKWRVLSGGSHSYLAPLTQGFKNNIHTGVDITSVQREQNSVTLHFENKPSQTFDHVIFATHSDQALALLDQPSQLEQKVLGAIPYKESTVTLHTDASVLPKNRRTWSSWNYRINANTDALPRLTYNMNILQGLQSPHTYCVSLNSEGEINEEKIIGKYRYSHPQFDLASIDAQGKLGVLNGQNNTWYCGAYWANGFHEDGLLSAIKVCKQFDCGPK